MTECGNYFLRYEYFTTNRALHTFGKSALGTSGCYCGKHYLGVTECCCKLFAANRTILCIDTICCCAGDVSERGNCFLCFEDFTANCALYTCGKSAFGTSRCYCRNYFFGMTKRRNLILRYEYCFTGRALHTCGKSAIGASGLYCGNNFFNVTERCDHLMSAYIAFASGAVIACRISDVGTGRLLRLNERKAMIER